MDQPFFVLSGFLITSGLIKNASVHEFLTRRLARILPLAYAYTAVVFLVFTFDPKKLLFTDIFSVNYLTQYLDSGWTEHLCSLCVEIHFYLAIALMVLLFGKRALWIVWPACLGITVLRISTGTYISLATHLRGDEILAGPARRRHSVTLDFVASINRSLSQFAWLLSYGRLLLIRCQGRFNMFVPMRQLHFY